jgi:hypothetical protein
MKGLEKVKTVVDLKSKRVLSILLTLVFVFASSTLAFAAWPGFQNDCTNNGVTDVLVTSPVTTYDDLANNGAWTGVSSPSVLNNGVAYSVYNGGTPSGAAGGARVQATTLSTAAPVWNIQLNDQADNISQLSTPVLADDTLYVLSTDTANLYTSSAYSTSVWTAGGGASIDNPTNVATFLQNTTSYIYSNNAEVTFAEAVDTLNLELGLVAGNNTSSSYTLQLYDSSDNLKYTLFSGVTIYGAYGNPINTYNGNIAAGSYKIKLTINAGNDNDVTGTFIKLDGYFWQLNGIDTMTTPTDNPAPLKDSGNGDVRYAGQANTPITHCGDYIYWGIYGGTKTYYQYKLSTGALNTFTPADDNFYWAGATAVTVTEAREVGCGAAEALVDVDYAVFGSDSGTVYWRDVADFENTGYSVDLTTVSTPSVADAGRVRSSIVAPGDGYIYFTSQGDTSSTGKPGYLWKFEEDGTYVGLVPLPGNSTSTPVISGNGYVYVGYYDHGNYANPNGGVAGVDNTSFASTFTVYPGDPVQGSPVVCSDGTDDFVYFTTNSSIGAGYCYSYDGSTAAQEWTTGGTSSNRYALQGFAADGGYLVYGDDGNRLYIIEE